MTQTILIVDDSEEAREHISGILTEGLAGIRTLTAPNGLDAFMLLVSRQVDLVLCDVVMPVLDGFKFLALKATRPDLSDVPVIILTVVEEVSQKVKALEAGAADCLTKPVHASELLARVRVHLKARSFQQELRRKNAELELLSNTDALTRIANRRHFLAIAEVELLRAAEERVPLSVVMVDIDHFKKINDDYGHLIGDQVLGRVADTLQGDLRHGEIAARYGGEEFAVLLPNTELSGAAAFAQRCRTRLEALRMDVAGRALSIRVQGGPSLQPAPVSVRNRSLLEPEISWGIQIPAQVNELRVTASFGVAGFPSPKIHTVDDLLRCADRALYRAKASGRDCVYLDGQAGAAS
ncbi:MAG TPA: diguanylate cyclase [Polyangiaceae bacterium]